MAILASFFAIYALLITAVGLYGTLAYSTARRTGEIGIRMALGAPRQNIVRLILTENALLVVGGCVWGRFCRLHARALSPVFFTEFTRTVRPCCWAPFARYFWSAFLLRFCRRYALRAWTR